MYFFSKNTLKNNYYHIFKYFFSNITIKSDLAGNLI
jgi:hypothetical protein